MMLDFSEFFPITKNNLLNFHRFRCFNFSNKKYFLMFPKFSVLDPKNSKLKFQIIIFLLIPLKILFVLPISFPSLSDSSGICLCNQISPFESILIKIANEFLYNTISLFLQLLTAKIQMYTFLIPTNIQSVLE